MAVIYECDGCDKTSKTYGAIKGVTIDVKSDLGQGPTELHLCEWCERHLREVVNPRTWARQAKPVKAA